MNRIFVVFILVQSFITDFNFAQGWSKVGENGIGCNGNHVNFIKVLNDELYVLGSFSTQCGGPGVGIAKWNGTKWDSLGWGVAYGNTYSVEIFNGELYLGGDFESAIDSGYSGTCCAEYLPNTQNLAKWDGLEWKSVSVNPPNYTINFLLLYKDNLYIGGATPFTAVDGIWCNHIAQYNGTTWGNMQGGVDGGLWPEVRTMEIYNNDLYVGGRFDHIFNTNLPVNNIAKWDGAKWDSVTGGRFNGAIATLLVDTTINVLYVGGVFTKVGDIDVNYIAKFDGNNWTDVGFPPACCNDFEIYRNKLFSCGQPGGGFTSLACWDGSQWKIINGPDTTTGARVNTLCVYQDELYVGGYFDSVDTGGGYLQVNYIARYWEPPVSIEEINKQNEDKYLGDPIPNPAHNSVTISYYVPDNSRGVITIRSLKGDLIKEFPVPTGKSQTEISLVDFSKTIYLYSILIDGNLKGMKRMVVE